MIIVIVIQIVLIHTNAYKYDNDNNKAAGEALAGHVDGLRVLEEGGGKDAVD